MDLTAKQERFAQAIVDGLDQTAAYRLAYDCEESLPATIYVHASQLAADDKVSTRILELRAPVATELAEARLWTAEKLAKEAETNLKGAREDHAWAPANKAIEIMARLTGNMDGPERATEVRITKVTVVLPPGTVGAIVDVEEYTVSEDEE